MSRIFDPSGSEQYVKSVDSVSMSAMTVGFWTKMNSFTNGGTFFVKDPVGSYMTSLEYRADGTLLVLMGGIDTSLGGISARSVNAAGTGYTIGDTGVITGCYPNVPGNYATVTVLNVNGGGGVTLLGIPANGSGFAVGNYPTSPAGAQPLSGTGFRVNADSIFNSSSADSYSNEALSLNVWTHIAVTWDGNGDGLARIYINGVEATYDDQVVGGNIRSASFVADSSTGPWVFGDDLFDYVLDGVMAEVAIYDTALTAGQVAALAASTTGATGSPIDYFHLCGTADPEPNVVNKANFGTLSTPPPTKGTNSPGFACSAGTVNTVGVGAYGGNTLAEAFYNPQQLDLLQVVNEGGEIVWNLTFDGTANTDPASPTANALLGIYEGESFALAFPNPYSKDILQIIGPGKAVVFWVDSTGTANTA